ncbi:integral membrane protein [Aspergillus fumigatus]|nr:integral membrane protein [Aspergillus fumigatus]
MGICQAVGAVLLPCEDLRTEFWTEFGRATVSGLTKEQLLRRAELASSWQNWVFNGTLTYVAAGLVEEFLKYIPVMFARRRDAKKKQRRDRAYIDYVLASALGFSVVENIGFIYSACVGGQESWPKLLLTLMERVVVGQLGHLSVACLTALRATRRDYHGDSLGLWGVIGPAVLFHGTYNFALMSVSVMEGNVGWIHPNGLRNTALALGLVSGMIGLAVRKAKQEWRKVQKHEQDRLKDDESRK